MGVDKGRTARAPAPPPPPCTAPSRCSRRRGRVSASPHTHALALPALATPRAHPPQCAPARPRDPSPPQGSFQCHGCARAAPSSAQSPKSAGWPTVCGGGAGRGGGTAIGASAFAGVVNPCAPSLPPSLPPSPAHRDDDDVVARVPVRQRPAQRLHLVFRGCRATPARVVGAGAAPAAGYSAPARAAATSIAPQRGAAGCPALPHGLPSQHGHRYDAQHRQRGQHLPRPPPARGAEPHRHPRPGD